MSHETPSMESSPSAEASPPDSPTTQQETELLAAGDEVTTRHQYYYFSEVIFLVEGSLFKVPRESFVENSELFRAMFQLPVPSGRSPDGSSDQNPLRLDGIEKTDFLQLLKVMFPRFPRQAEAMTWAEWFSVLKLAIMWQMDEMRELAIERITTLPVSVNEWLAVLKLSTSRRISEVREKAIERLTQSLQLVDRVALAVEFQVAHWLLLGCRDFVTRDETISERDERRLGSKTTIKLFRTRDAFRRRWNAPASEIDAAVRRVFEAELKEAEYLDS